MHFVRNILSGVLLALAATQLTAGEAVIIDHLCTDINKVPKSFIEKAKNDLRISYTHNAHGSQIVSGMDALKQFAPLYRYSKNGKAGKILSFWDNVFASEIAFPDIDTWTENIRKFLKEDGKSRNLMVFSWENQLSEAKKKDVEEYLEAMKLLEEEFPQVKFVYMTGHLDGTGKEGNLNQRNEQIREFCRENGKILYDFADIESFEPNGTVNYMELNGKDTCSYKKAGVSKNWAEEWLNLHPESRIVLPGKAKFTNPLNAALKGRAFWWMLARAAGWGMQKRPGHPEEKKPADKDEDDDKADSSQKPQPPPGKKGKAKPARI